MKHLLLITGLIAIVFTSCNSGSVYREFAKTDDLEWLKGDIKSFTFNNTDDTSKVTVFFAFRYAEGYPFPNALVKIIEQTPQGKQTLPLDFLVRNNDGSYIGDGSGDIWDIEVPLHENITLEKGTYTYNIENVMPVEKVPMIMEVGIIIKHAEND